MEDVEASVFLDNSLNHRLAVVGPADIGSEHRCLASLGSDRIQCLGGAVFLIIDQQDLRSLSRKEDGRGFAIAHDLPRRSGAGYDGYLPLKPRLSFIHYPAS